MYLKLKELRLKHNYTDKDMGEKLHISKSFYSQIENGRRRLNYDMAVKIANVFKLKPDTIFYKEQKKQSNE